MRDSDKELFGEMYEKLHEYVELLDNMIEASRLIDDKNLDELVEGNWPLHQHLNEAFNELHEILRKHDCLPEWAKNDQQPVLKDGEIPF